MVFGGLAGVTAAITMLFLGMRSVMEIGGFCAEGGPFEIARRCPEGIPLVMVSSILGGLVLFGLYWWNAAKSDVPSLAALAWPALFISLGWNFWEFGLNPPGSDGVELGWIIPAVLFVAMGGLPLLIVLPALVRRFTGSGPPRNRGAADLLSPGSGPTTDTMGEPSYSTGESTDLITALERLDALHRSGALDDEEFEKAKERILRAEGR